MNCLKQDIGNATKESDITFILQTNPDYKGDVPEEIPIQVQISCTRQDGSKLLRVITARQKTTQDRTKMEEVRLSLNLISLKYPRNDCTVRHFAVKVTEYMQNKHRACLINETLSIISYSLFSDY